MATGKRLIDLTMQERSERVHGIIAATSTDSERQALYWEFCLQEVAELNALGGPRIVLPALGAP